MSEPGNPDDVWNMLKNHRIAMFTTEDQGQLVSRPMASLARPEENRIYFITKLHSGKVEELGRMGPVNLAYADERKENYLSIAGTAKVSQDRAKLKELWSFFAEAWIPEGPEAPDTALIEVEPNEAKLWDGTSSSLIKGAKMLSAVIAQDPPKTDRVVEVSMND